MRSMCKRPQVLWWISMALIVAVAAVLRLWELSARPGFEWDETVYANIGMHVADSGQIVLKPQYGATAEPYLFHPPFYFLLLGAWMKAFGTTIAAARYLSAIGSLFTIVFTGLLLRRLIGWWSLIGALFIAIDGWIVYENRISWIDNSLMLLIMIGMLCYVKALQTEKTRWFVVAGLILGFAGVYKIIGLYIILVVALHWILSRSSRKKHLYLFGAALGVIVAYLVTMSIWFNENGQNFFWVDSWKQFNRAIGATPSQGVVTPTNVLQPLLAQYSIFTGMLIVAIVTGVLLVYRSFQMIKRRSTAPVAGFLVLYCWTLVSIVCFGALGLKFPSYFILVLTPMILYLCAEVGPTILSLRKRGRSTLAKILIGVVVVVGIADLAAFDLRIVNRTDNALGQTAQYAQMYIPKNALVITEETIGPIIPQQYCPMWNAAACRADATYVITYTSATQKTLDTPAVNDMLATGVEVAQFKGFKETITVYKVTPP